MTDVKSYEEKGWRGVWRGMGSVKLALFLFLILALTSIVGTIIPQGADPAFYEQQYGEKTLRVLSFLGLVDLFHSWWFISILFLLSINLVVCSFQRLPSWWKVLSAPPIRVDEERAKDLPLQRSLSFYGENPRSHVEKVFRENGYRPRVEAEPASLHMVASKGQWSRIGPYLVHLSVLIILLGATLGALLGFRGFVHIPEGETVDSFQVQNEKSPKEMGFSLRCDDFEVSYYEGTQRPQEYRSELVIIEAGEEVVKKAIRVNDPLAHKGIHFYQSSFGNTGQVKSITLSLENPVRKESLQIKVPVGKVHRVEGTDYLVQVLRFLPDFALDEHFVPFSRTDEFRNPAAEIEIKKGGRSLLHTWVFGRQVSFHGPRVRSGLRAQLTDYEAIQFTGLQVSYDPGVGWVWAGFFLMSIGLALSLLFTEKRIWIRMTQEEGRWKAQAWGQARRGKSAFEHEFTRICTKLEGNGSNPEQKRGD